jgi:hypothetical protein
VSPPEEAPADDPSITDDDDLLRRVPNVPHMLSTQGDGTIRITSAALIRKGERGCSVSVRTRLPNPDAPVEILDEHQQRWGIATCTAGVARNGGEHHVTGVPEPNNPAHAEITPTAPTRKEQKRFLKALAERMHLIREPTLTGRADHEN